MIHVFRKEMKKWHSVLWVVLAAFVLGIVFTYQRRSDPGSERVASVNGSSISFKQYHRVLNEIRMQIDMYKNYAKAYGISVDLFLNMAGLNNPERAAFDRCVRNELIDQEAADLNIKLNLDYFSEQLAKTLPPQLKDQAGQINMEAYKFYLSKLLTTISEYEDSMGEEFKRELFNDFVRKSAYISNNEAKEVFEQGNLKKSFQVLSFPLENFLNEVKKEEPEAKELKEFFQKDKENYRVPEKRKAEYWIISPQEYAKKIVVDDDAIQAFYARNKSSLFRIPPKIKVKHILIKVDEKDTPEKVSKLLDKAKDVHKQAIQNPEKFDQLVKKYSQDTQTTAKGGVIDFFERGTYDPEFERVAFRLKEKNEISDIVKTDKGYEIVQLMERVAASEKSLESVRDEIIKTIKARKALNSLKGDIERVLYETKRDKDAISKFVEKNGLKTEKTEWLTQKDTQGIELKNLLAEKLFPEQKKEIVQGVFTHKDDQVLYRSIEVEKSFIPELTKTEKAVLQNYFRHKAKRKQKVEVRKAKRELLQKKINMEELSKKLNLKLITTGLVSKKDEVDSLKEAKQLIQNAFILDDPFQVLSSRDDSNYYLVKLIESEKIETEVFAEQKRDIKKTEEFKAASLCLEGFIASLLRLAKIEKLQNF